MKKKDTITSQDEEKKQHATMKMKSAKEMIAKLSHKPKNRKMKLKKLEHVE